MITFNPGPSALHPNVESYFKEGLDEGFYASSHRNERFVEVSKACIGDLKLKLSIPDDYVVLYTNSATESWEIIAQSLMKGKSAHFYSGAFGEKFFKYTKNLRGDLVLDRAFDGQLKPEVSRINNDDVDMICLAHNETSNGTALNDDIFKSFKESYPQALIAVDTTSSLAGIGIDFSNMDIIYASVQKCFGLPAGLGLLILSPQAIERANELGDRKHYNSVLFMLDKMKDWQTTFTPNILGIYLLHKRMAEAQSIATVDNEQRIRYRLFAKVIDGLPFLDYYIKDQSLRSKTVFCLTAAPEIIIRLKKAALAQGITLGAGYGGLKKTTFRIANFPAITDADFSHLISFLKAFH